MAERIARVIGSDLVDLHDIIDSGPAAMTGYDCLIVGIPTWDFGEQQEDWLEVWPELDDLQLSGRFALFGLGDQIGYGEWYLDAMGMLHDKLRDAGAEPVGYWPVDGYDFESSRALTADRRHFVGLALDEDSQRAETDGRIAIWVPQVLDAFGLS
ncbi:flavodoxin FldB [Marinobacterium nitratireducens]|uniref:Flavodoxin n=1 Tax=Marinobacterium nitratireducens TaxID=518897 RepID=A0A917ZLD3_9GAMM|nr:flavodoxin FldB [Marinobacterium nitratireducens]